MKIKSIFLFLALSLLTSQAVAKENKVINEAPNVELTAKKKDSREEIHTFDFKKVFAEAEVYYKAAKSWQKLKCEPKSGFICTKHDCVKRDIKNYLILDKKAKIITRCDDKKNCEIFPAEFDQTGVFFNVQTEGPVGTLIRILGDSRYKEITTVALDAYVANGECKVLDK